MNTVSTKHLFSIVIVLCLVGLGIPSCNRSELSPNHSHTKQLSEGERFVQVDLNSSINETGDNFRFSYHDKDFHSTSGGIKLYPIMEEKDLKILVVARQEGGKTTHNHLVFKKIAGKRQVKYTGKIKVPNSNKNRVELAAIVLGEVGGRQFVTFDENSKRVRVIPSPGVIKEDDTDIVSTTVPYLARWTPIEIIDDTSIEAGARLAESATLQFKPSGCLLRFEISYSQPPKVEPDGSVYYDAIEIRELEVRTNAFFLDWEYDFEQLGQTPSVKPNTLADGILVDNSNLNRTFRFPVNRTIQANGTTTPGYFIWGMPRSQADRDANLRTDFIIHLVPGEGFLESRRISSKFLPTSGGSNNITLRAETGKEIY